MWCRLSTGENYTKISSLILIMRVVADFVNDKLCLGKFLRDTDLTCINKAGIFHGVLLKSTNNAPNTNYSPENMVCFRGLVLHLFIVDI